MGKVHSNNIRKLCLESSVEKDKYTHAAHKTYINKLLPPLWQECPGKLRKQGNLMDPVFP